MGIYTILSTMWLVYRQISSEVWLYITVKTLNNIRNIMAYVSVNGRFNGDSSWGLNEVSPANIYIYTLIQYVYIYIYGITSGFNWI